MNVTRSAVAAILPPRLRVYHFLIALWALTMISIPIIRWVVGDAVLHWGVIAGVLLQVAAVLAVLVTHLGWRATARIVAIVVPLAWLAEYIGSTTGIPFGAYHYTAALSPLLGGVPLVIPFAWLMMLPPAWAVAQHLTGGSNTWRFVLAAAAAFTVWDLFLDPQMVGWGYWVWDQPGAYFGIPWVNFLGWLIASALITVAVHPPLLPFAPLFAIYVITWFLQSFGQFFFWQMPGPALVGFVGMGVFVVLSINKLATMAQSTQSGIENDGS